MRSLRTPARQQSVVTYATVGALARRPDAITGEQMLIVVARRRHSHDWVGGIARLMTVEAPHVVLLTDGRRLVVADLRPEDQVDSYQASLMVEAVEREAAIEAEVEAMLADPQAALDLFKWAADYVPDPA